MNDRAQTTKGLSSADAEKQLARYGPNSLPTATQRSILAIAVEVLRQPMFLLLIAAALVYLLLGDSREALILAASIVVVVIITLAQERKSERALEALRDLSSPRAMVVRDGEKLRIAGTAVVPGDLLLLAEGDRVPADAKLLAVNDLKVDESLLTGESVPVDKRVGNDGTRETAVYSGTLVVKGQAEAEVTATGAHSEMGRIGKSLAALAAEKTLLQTETDRVVKLIAAAALLLCVVLAAFYVATRGDLLAGILAGLTLAIALVPEEFPVVLTVFLALGAWRISRHGVLTRRMPAIETLGAATVLCVDKTGTLTENRMTVVEAFDGRNWLRPDAPSDEATALLEAAALACEPEPFDPMERAILAAASKLSTTIAAKRAEWVLTKDYPLTTDFLAVCHVWRVPDSRHRIALKGAPETVLPLCGLDSARQAAALDQALQAAGRGLRLLAVAAAEWEDAPLPEDPRRYPYRWLGYVALADPLRPSVPDAVALCRRAGIRVVMITGDHAATAAAIGRQAGIANHSEILSGSQLASMSDAELAEAVRHVNVFARILPEQKLRLISAYKTAGEVVAMTGDGVNDAPALKAAHIGLAMGRRGTDVAREASALVLLEDDFSSIVDTVRIGRRIYDNIRNAMAYLLAVHVPIAGMSFLPLLFGGPMFLFPVHVLFLEFVIDPACSIVFEAEESEQGAMERPPRPPAERLFNLQMLGMSMLLGAGALAGACATYLWALGRDYSEAEVRAIGFAAIVFANLALILVNRSRERTLLETLRRPNRAAWWVVGGTLLALAAAIYVPMMAEVFRFSALGPKEALVAFVMGSAGVLWFELVKLARGRV